MKYFVMVLMALLLLRSLIPRKKLKRKEGRDQAEPLNKDPVCGMYVSESDAFSLKAGGETYYFCSKDCLRTFARRTG